MPNDETKKIKWAPKLSLVLLGIGLVLIVGGLLWHRPPSQTLRIGGSKLHFTVADTPAERAHGLCCRTTLPANEGMLFVYPKAGDYKYWMKDTQIPLDMYWLSSSKKIVHIEPSIQPSSYPKTFASPTLAQYVLETNAGYAKSQHIQVGDQASFALH